MYACSPPQAGWLSLVEDDTELCEGGLRSMTAFLARAGPAGPGGPAWRVATFGSFFSGTTLAAPGPAAAFAHHAARNMSRKPVRGARGAWAGEGETRRAGARGPGEVIA